MQREERGFVLHQGKKVLCRGEVGKKFPKIASQILWKWQPLNEISPKLHKILGIPSKMITQRVNPPQPDLKKEKSKKWEVKYGKEEESKKIKF